MRSMKSFFGFRKIQKKYICMLAVMSLLSVITISTYAYFVISTEGYKASELLVAELAYGITVVEDGSTGSDISNNTVLVPAGKKAYFNITVSSVNKIDSRYTLAFKTTSDAVVQYTDKTDWSSQGFIKGYDENTYTKKIRVVVDNSNGSNNASVTFAVFGGYTFNSYAAISLGDGYFSVSGPYQETTSITAARLVDIVEEAVSCTTEDAKSCMYGGGAINNYFQYPENEDKTKNIWRLIGTYQLGDEVLAKIVSESTGTTAVANISTSLSSFYGTLENANRVVKNTNLFNCGSTGCTASSYEKVGLISTYEYEKLGGSNSYLVSNNSYFALNGSNVSNITSNGIEETNADTTSGLRPTIYLQTDVKVTGSGTVTDPFVINQSSDINLVAYTLDGEVTDKTYSWLLSNKVVNSVSCEKGTKASWNYNNNTITLSDVHVPDYCTIDFKDGYIVTMKATGGTVKEPASLSTGHNGSVNFTVTPNTDFVLAGSTVSCTNGAKATINQTTGVVTVNSVTASTTCTAVMAPDKLTLYAQLLQDNPTHTGSRPGAFSSVYTADNTGVMYVANGNQTEDGSNVYYFAGNAKNNWVRFGKDSTGADLYWRIIRTNEDGSVRMLYAGTSVSTTEGYINASQAYNPTRNNPMYVGYMYGSSGSLANNRTNTTNSPIKTVVDNWYNAGLNSKTDASGNKYDAYISQTAIYCNDRANEGYSTSSTFYYATYKRLIDAKAPSYKCGNNASGSLYTGTNGANVADKFSKNTSKGGNGKLTYPVALMTADEISFAGGLYATNAPAWYYYNSGTGSITGDKWWWTMSPYYFGGSYARVFYVCGSSIPGCLDVTNVNNTNGVRPVVSLKSCALASGGNGSSGNPYTIQINSTCASAVN